MSYLKTKSNAVVPYAMGDFACWLPLFNTVTCPSLGVDASLAACSSDADAQVADLDAKWYDLAQNWHPTGTYDPQTALSLVQQQAALISSARQALDAAENNAPGTLGTALENARWQLDQVGVKASAIAQGANDALSQGIDQVQIDGLRDWVIDSMVWSSNALHTAYDVACQKDKFGALVSYGNAVVGGATTLYNAAKAVAGIVYDALKKAAKIGLGALDLLAWLEKYGPMIGVGLVAWWIFVKEKKRGAAPKKAFLAP